MEIVEPLKERNITDYDFMFVSGAKLAVSIDKDAGDHVDELSDRYVLDVVAKPSLTDLNDITDAETLQVFKLGLAAVSICSRKQRMPTEEELFDMQKTLHALAKEIQ